MMIRSCVLFCLVAIVVVVVVVDGQNVVMTSSGAAIAVNGSGNGLIISSIANNAGDREQSEFNAFDSSIVSLSSFDDVSIDPANENLVFALTTEGRSVCSFVLDFGGNTAGGEATMNTDDPVVNAVNCVGVFSVSPFCGVSAYGGTLMISGGTGGFTIYEYDPQTGLISDPPIFLNNLFPNIIGHPDVVMLDANLAALSTDFSGGSFRFGTQMATIDVSELTVSFGLDYRVENTLGFDLILPPTNFPLVNAMYRSGDDESSTIMYTANGPMQIQDLSSTVVTVLTAGVPNGFSAVTVAVNQAKKIVVFGGVLASGGSQILFYDLSTDPMDPTLVDSQQATGGGDTMAEIEQRITSVASGGDVVAFVTSTFPGIIQFLDLPIAGGSGGTSDSDASSSTGNTPTTGAPDDTASSDSSTIMGDSSENSSSSGSPRTTQISSSWWQAGRIIFGLPAMVLFY